MFTYISLLIDEDHFDTIEIFFLIVGHTHASIDQYFSTLSNLIQSREFIGSPLALEALLASEEEPKQLSGITPVVTYLCAATMVII